MATRPGFVIYVTIYFAVLVALAGAYYVVDQL